MTAAQRSRPRDNLQAAVVSTLVGLLFSTGLRIGEALWLKLGDVDLQRQVIQVREGKFHKSRYVPLSPSTTAQLKVYLRHRQQAGLSNPKHACFVIRVDGCTPVTFATHSSPSSVQLGIRAQKAQRVHRVHDLRHALPWAAWCSGIAREPPHGQASQSLLLDLFGDTHVDETELYRTPPPNCEQAGERFHNHIAIPPERRIRVMQNTI